MECIRKNYCQGDGSLPGGGGALASQQTHRRSSTYNILGKSAKPETDRSLAPPPPNHYARAITMQRGGG